MAARSAEQTSHFWQEDAADHASEAIIQWMKRSPTNSRGGTSDVDLCTASPKRVPTGPQNPFGGRNSAVSDPIPVRVRQIVGLVRRNEGTIALKWPGDGAGEGQMGYVG